MEEKVGLVNYEGDLLLKKKVQVRLVWVDKSCQIAKQAWHFWCPTIAVRRWVNNSRRKGGI